MTANNLPYDEILAQAKRVIINEFAKANIEISRILLFGSRAKGHAKPDSDWDLLVVTSVDLPFEVRWDMIEAIQERLHATGQSFDLIVCSHAKWIQDKDDVGAISYYANQGGVLV